MSDKEKSGGDERSKSTITCTILRDRWDANGDRQPKGTQIEVPVSEAMDGVESGALARVK